MIADIRFFDTFPPDEVRLPMCEWLRHHGVDPNDVAVPGWIEIVPELRQIRYERYATNERGQPLVIADEIVREEHVVQLEAEPSEFPTLPWAAE